MVNNNEGKAIDLHIHTTASDGSCTPAEILKMAKNKKLGAVSITDHDTLQGVIEVLQCQNFDSVKFLNGIEISSAAPSS